MFEDLICKKPKRKKINLIATDATDDIIVCKEFLEDCQEVLWDLEKEPCFHCGAELGTEHKDSCLYLQVLNFIQDQLK